MQAGQYLNEFVEYIEENDIDLSELESPQDIMQYDFENRAVVLSFLALSDSLIELGKQFDDESDENPFKVSDGDDPVY